MNRRKYRGPWPLSAYESERLRKVGGRPADFQAVEWSNPREARPRVLAALVEYLTRGDEVLAEIEATLRLSGTMWDQGVLAEVVRRSFPEIDPAVMKLLLAIFILARPHLASRIRGAVKGKVHWMLYFQRVGWVPRGVDEAADEPRRQSESDQPDLFS